METSSSTSDSNLPLASILDPSHPLSYLAYLPPSAAYELTVSLYIIVAALAVQIWDVLNNLNEDYKLLRNPKSLPLFVYFIARLSTVTFLLDLVIYNTVPLGSCERLSKLASCIFCVALGSTSLLFYFRVRAMYLDHRYVSPFFFFMWLAVVGSSITTVTGIGGTAIGPTKHCLNGPLNKYIGIFELVPLTNDTLIFVATSIRLFQSGLPEGAKRKDVLNALISGEGLTRLTRALFQDGQAYYLSTACLFLMNFIIFYIDSIPMAYRATVPLIEVTLINIMASRVYRRTKSGRYLHNSISESKFLADFSKELQFRRNESVEGSQESSVLEESNTASVV